MPRRRFLRATGGGCKHRQGDPREPLQRFLQATSKRRRRAPAEVTVSPRGSGGGEPRRGRGSGSRERCALLTFSTLWVKVSGKMCDQWQVGNYLQHHQLPKLVEHILRRSQKTWSGAGAHLEEVPKLVEQICWSRVELVDLFGFFLEWSCFLWAELFQTPPQRKQTQSNLLEQLYHKNFTKPNMQ